jgi:hypothetical protein
MLILLVTALLTTTGCADGDGLLPLPRDRWLSDSRRSPHIFSEWTGVTGQEIVYGYDGTPFQVTILKNVQGPDAAEAFENDSPLGEKSQQPRTHYLSSADDVLLLASEVQPELKVRVDGFMRAWSESGSLWNPNSRMNEVASKTPPGPPGDRKLDRFDLIKVRKIWQILPDGTERLIWETGVPFRGL